MVAMFRFLHWEARQSGPVYTVLEQRQLLLMLHNFAEERRSRVVTNHWKDLRKPADFAGRGLADCAAVKFTFYSLKRIACTLQHCSTSDQRPAL